MYNLGYKYLHICDDRAVIVQDFDGAAVEDGDDAAGEVGGKSFVRTKNYCPRYKHKDEIGYQSEDHRSNGCGGNKEKRKQCCVR